MTRTDYTGGQAATGETRTALAPSRSEHARTGWGFWLKWSLATLLGLVAGTVVFIAVGMLAGDAIERLPESVSGFVSGLVLGGIFGIAFGLSQWVILRLRLRRAAAWVGATLVGFVVGAAIIFGLMDGSNQDTSLVVKLGHALVLGASLGVAQWFVLRSRLDGASLWIAVSLVSWVTAELVGVALSALAGPPLDLLGLFLVGGVLPGAGMAWLLGRMPGQGNSTRKAIRNAEQGAFSRHVAR